MSQIFVDRARIIINPHITYVRSWSVIASAEDCFILTLLFYRICACCQILALALHGPVPYQLNVPNTW